MKRPPTKPEHLARYHDTIERGIRYISLRVGHKVRVTVTTLPKPKTPRPRTAKKRGRK